MKPKVYLETTIPSYLTSRPCRDLMVAAHQQVTSDWWHDHRNKFSLFVSPRVLADDGSDDPAAAARRLAELEGILILPFTPEARLLVTRFLASGLIPDKSAEHAAHIAIATVHGMDYLLTWNCRHIVNAEIMKPLAAVALAGGYPLPMLCTPEQLIGTKPVLKDPILEEIRRIRDEHAAPVQLRSGCDLRRHQKKREGTRPAAGDTAAKPRRQARSRAGQAGRPGRISIDADGFVRRQGTPQPALKEQPFVLTQITRFVCGKVWQRLRLYCWKLRTALSASNVRPRQTEKSSRRALAASRVFRLSRLIIR